MASTNSGSARNVVPMQYKYDRVVVLVDMDCFYCQVEEKLEPSYKGQPLAVVQYNAWRGGGIIAVNYAARAKGVTRHMRGDEAKNQCPEIILAKVPSIQEKADLSKYRDAGKEVANVLQRYTQILERASVDEAYMDITESVNKRLEGLNAGAFVLQPQELINTYAVGYANIGEYVNKITSRFPNPFKDDEQFLRYHDYNDLPAVRQSDIRLLIGASIAGEIRAAVKAATGYECSAGIAHNKILAKLACGINKPNKQTILPLLQIPGLFEMLPVGKITGLGAKFGVEVCERLNIKYIGQLLKFTEHELQRKFGEKNGSWLHNLARGIDLEAVTPRFYSKSIGCTKNFPGRNNITGVKTLEHWLNGLAKEVNERLQKDMAENNRKAKQMVVSYTQDFDGEEISSSRTVSLSSYDQDALAKAAVDVIKANTKTFFRPGSNSALNNAIRFLGISAGKFETITNAQTRLQDMFANQAAKKRRISDDAGQTQAQIQTVLGDSSTKKDPEQKVEKNEAKMKSFFANYLQSGKVNGNDQSKTNKDKEQNETHNSMEQMATKSVDDMNNAGTSKNSFLLNYFKQQNKKELKEDSTQESQTKGEKIDPNKSFLLKALREEKEDQQRVEENDNEFQDDQQVSLKTKSNEQRMNTGKSFLLNALQEENKRNQIEDNQEKIVTSPSFLLQAMQAEKENKKTNDNLHKAKAAELKEEFQLQLLAAEMQEMESSESKTDELCRQILLLNESDETESQDYIINDCSRDIPISNTKRKLIDDSREDDQAATATQSNDFRNNYAEFAIPELREDLMKFIKCEQCGAKIPDDPCSLQTHQDHHFAHQLSQQQREEFRSEMQNKKSNQNQSIVKGSPNTSKNNNKQHKKNTSSSNKFSNSISPKANITKFLKPKENTTLEPPPTPPLSCEPSTSSAAAAANEPTELCRECQNHVKVSEFTEHMDYHVAKQLQRKLNQLEVRTVTVTKKPSASSKSKDKSQNNTTNPLNRTQTQNNGNKTIAQFFSQAD